MRKTGPLGGFKRHDAAPVKPVTGFLLVLFVVVAITQSGLIARLAGVNSSAGWQPQPIAIGGWGGRFGVCHIGGGRNCVVDGDTFYIEGEKVRIATIDAPETHPPRCAEEARLGAAATRRLRDLLNKGEVSLVAGDRDRDVYGRLLRIPYSDGVDVAAVLVEEGLARPFGNGRRPWC